MSDQCYFTDAAGRGNFYQCLTATSTGQSPATAPAKWNRIPIPARFRWVLARLTYAGLLELDGQTDKALVERQKALTTDRKGLEVLVMNEANREGFLDRPDVRTPQDPLARSNIFFTHDHR